MILIDIGAVLVLACVVVIAIAAIMSEPNRSFWEDIKESITVIGVSLLIIAACLLVGLSIDHVSGML
jgi:NADH:ubiquinone oxidoreductase subunit 6 (subunit J)